MSLLGRKEQHHGEMKERGRGQRKTKAERIFKLPESELEIDDIPNSTNSSLTFLADLNDDPFSASLAFSSSSSSESADKNRSKAVSDVLASSKLSTISSEGPIEPSPRLGKRKLKAAKKHVKSLTKGAAWFDMAKVEVTKEKKDDLEALKLRSAMESVYHYKRNNITHTPKYFHVGKVVESKADFYSSRIPKRQRKKTLAQEFAADFGME